MPVDHYENFPVASWLLPKGLRQPIEVIYAFARSADDFADEGTWTSAERLALLGEYKHELDLIVTGTPSDHPLFSRLHSVIQLHALPVQLFRDLLDAFSQDVTKTRYRDFAELQHYCDRSANPIGRLMLHLYRQTAPQNFAWSDAICTGLQLANHWQDVAIDWKKNGVGRIYLPQDELSQFGLGEGDIEYQRCSDAWSALMKFQCARARALLLEGKPLGRALPGRIGIELRTIIAGGLTILDKIDAVHGDVFRNRPRVTRWDWAKILPRTLLPM